MARFGRFVRAHALSLLALSVALGGTAWAGSLVESQDIADDAVRSRHIAAGSVRRSDVRAGAVNSAKVRDGSLADDDLGPSAVGPSELSRVVVRTALAAVPNGSSASVNAQCLAGEEAVGGGGSLSGFATDVNLISSRPADSANGFEVPADGTAFDAWRASAVDTVGGSGASVSVRAHVLCLQRAV